MSTHQLLSEDRFRWDPRVFFGAQLVKLNLNESSFVGNIDEFQIYKSFKSFKYSHLVVYLFRLRSPLLKLVRNQT